MSDQLRKDVLVERQAPVLTVTLNRPDRMNALTASMLDYLTVVFEHAADDPHVRAIVLTGRGRAFSAGIDLTSGDDGAAPPDAATVDAANRLTMAIRRAPKPVVAAVNGPVVGVACSFALAADITVATESAYVLFAFTNVGLMPDGGATALLPTSVGRARALRAAMLAERISAADAAAWGLIADVVPDAEFTTAVERTVGRLAEGPTAAYAHTKRAINETVLACLPQALEAERAGQTALLGSKDFHEAVAAFRDKRKPNFAGP